MKKTAILVTIIILSMVAGVLAFKLYSSKGSVASSIEIDWRLLGEMDYITGKSPDELKSLSGKKVKIPGFMVPLEDNQKKVTEFLLVPTPQACIHVPAPPPNQMVYVKMKEGVEAAFGPIWVYGDLNLVTKQSMYGDASFELQGDLVEPYQ